MAVQGMTCDKWDGPLNHEEVVANPSQADFERSLDRLDARTYTMLTLEAEGEQHLTIGGGAGQYVVYATFDNEEFWNLLRVEPAEGVVMLSAGGQEGDYPAAQVVDKEQARRAGSTFLQACSLDPTLRWEKG